MFWLYFCHLLHHTVLPTEPINRPFHDIAACLYIHSRFSPDIISFSEITFKHLQNVKYFNCLGSMMTNAARHTCEIKSRIDVARDDPFYHQIGLKFKEELCMVLKLWKVVQEHLESFIIWCWRSMEKIFWIDCAWNEEVLHRAKQKRNILIQ